MSFFLIAHMVLCGVFVSGLTVLLLHVHGATTTAAAPLIPTAQNLPTTTPFVLGAHTQLFDRLLPEQDNPSIALLKKLETPPPPPPLDCAVDPCVALTFDDGPTPDSTPMILTALEKAHAKATFFLIGVKIATNEATLRRMQADGDDIGNHSWTHPFFTKIPDAQIHQQIDLTQTAIVAAGVPAPYLFRPPYGAITPLAAHALSMPVIIWNVDPKDWNQKDTAGVVQQVEAQVKPGAIVVMHDKTLTASAIDKILYDLKSRYHLVTVSQLLGINSASRGIFFGR